NDFNFVAGKLSQPDCEQRTLGRILAAINSFAVRINKSWLKIIARHGTHAKQLGWLGRNLRCEFAKRDRVVKNCDAAAMRCDDKGGCARMNLDVIHADRRNIAGAHPMRALIERHEHSEVRTRVE